MKKIRKKTRRSLTLKNIVESDFDTFWQLFYPPLETWQPILPYLTQKKLWWNLFFFFILKRATFFSSKKTRKKEFRKYGKKVKFCLAKLVRNISTVCLHCLQLSMPENKNFTYSNVALLRRRQKNKYKIRDIGMCVEAWI